MDSLCGREKAPLIDLGQTLLSAFVENWNRKNGKNFNSGNETIPIRKAVVVYACSGCSDPGEIADRIARRLTRDGAAQMSCLAGIGGRVNSLMLKAENAERILVVDGCPLNCAAHTLRLAGFEKFEHLELHKIGLRKGSCPVTDNNISAGVEAAKKMLSRVDENYQS